MPRATLVLAAALLSVPVMLGACSPDAPAEARPEQDPAVSAALGEQLMTDPDLARINAHNRVLTGGGPAAAPIPLEDRSPEAIARARADAARILGAGGAAGSGAGTGAGGGAVLPPPGPALAPAPRDTPALAAAAALGPEARGCVDRLEHGFAWAARLPAAMPIYPRGHAQDAAGTDARGCALRVVNYVTPVPPAEVALFYWAAARRAGLAPRYGPAGADQAVLGSKGAGRAAAFIGRRADGLTQVDLVTSGL